MPKKEKGKGSDNEASLTANRCNFLQSKQKKKDSVENQDNQNYESNINDDSNKRVATDDLILRLEDDAQVGAFAVPGVEEGMNDLDESELPDTRLSMAQTSQDVSSLKITSARVVNDVIIDATPLEDNATPLEEMPKRGSILRYSLVAIVPILLLMAIIIPTIILTRQSPNDEAANEFLEKLEPLLTNASRQELELPESIPSISLSWLIREANFETYSFDRQVQRFAMAVFFYSTEGRSWNESQGWLTDADECTWYQSSYGNVCVNGTLQVLYLQDNTLKGLLPKEIDLLSSLTALGLSDNSLSGSIPSEIAALTELTALGLDYNSLTGSIPSEIAARPKLTYLSLKYNSLTGSIPSEIGALTTLTELDLYGNSLNGTIPSEIGALKKLTLLDLGANSLTGFIPSEIGALTTLSSLYISINSLNGTIPSEIDALTTLTHLALTRNFLSGSIPSEISALTRLKGLYLYSNSLTGSIPSEIGALTTLADLDLSSNSLTGSIPESLCKQGLNPSVDKNVTCSCCN